jgi:acetyl-CoA carboxylase biotin carboxyl carrier protein
MASDRSRSPKPAAAPSGNGDPAEVVRNLAGIMTEHSLNELVYDTPDVTITLRRGGPVMPMPMPMPMSMPTIPMPMGGGGHAPPASPGAAAVAAAVAVEEKGHVVTSPFVGTFYRRPNPDAPNYVAVNDKVEKGQVLCIVEAMKLMNEIEADIAGTILHVLAEDGAPVEYGQPLFKIAPG